MHDLERRADAAAQRGDVAEALRHLRALLAKQPDQFALWLKTAAMERATGNDAGALKTLKRALALSPLDFHALLMRATILHAHGGLDVSGEAYARALAQVPEPLPQQLTAVVATARARHDAWRSAERAALRDRAGAWRNERLDTMIDSALRLAPPDRPGPTHYCYPGLPELAFHPRERFPWIAALEAAAPDITAEFRAIDLARETRRAPYIRYPAHAPVDQWRALNHNRDWTAIHLIQQGTPVVENARQCPATMAALAQLPQPCIEGVGPNAMFSLLAPHTHIPPHHGVANTRLVCHLPLIVPTDTWFRVGGERRHWVEGEAWVFDDTIEHEAMNASDALRVVLIADVWHPDLNDQERAGIAAVMAASGRIHAL